MTKSQRLAKRAAGLEKAGTSRTEQQRSLTKWKLQPQSPFLRLPGEVRNAIYRLVLSPADDRRIRLNNLDQPPLTATCRQIQAEALPIFLSTNRFELGQPAVEHDAPHRMVTLFTKAWMEAAGGDAAHFLDVCILRAGMCIEPANKSIGSTKSTRHGFHKLSVKGRSQQVLDDIFEFKVKDLKIRGLSIEDVLRVARVAARS